MSGSVNGNDKIEQILFKFSKHPTTLKIKQKVKINIKFFFQSICEDTVKNVVKNLPSNKATAGEIPVDILKNSEFCLSELTKCINKAFNENKFPDTLKFSDTVPVFKKLDSTDKTNFRPSSVLPLLSKVFEKTMYDQFYEYAETFLNKLLCGFCKAHSTQHARFRLLQKWKKELDSSGIEGTILMDLSKAYDCLPDDLIIAKLEAYGLDTNSLRFIFEYLSCRKQRTKMGSAYSNWSKVLCGIPQGSILGPLLFNIFIKDAFFFIEKSEICNFADDNTLYSCDRNLLHIKKNLTFDMKNISFWFTTNSLKANAGKFQFMILDRKNHRRQRMVINSITVKESNDVILLGITIDDKLVFKKHIENLCRTAQYKFHALTRIRKYLTLDKAILLGNTFINSQFNYAPLIWMFCKNFIL